MNRICNPTLKGLSVSKNTHRPAEKGRLAVQPGMHTDHYLDFEVFRKDLRRNYSSGYVEENFYKAQGIIGKPVKNCVLAFVTVKLKGKSADWICANNALNAFEFKIKRKFWKRKWKYMNTMIGVIEPDKDYLTFHFHALIVCRDMVCTLSNQEIEDAIKSEVKDLKETNEKSAGLVRVRMFPFSAETTDLGDTIEYLVKTSSKEHDPMNRKVLNKSTQMELAQS